MTRPGAVLRSVALHGAAVVVFGLLALSGAGAAAVGLWGLAVPFIVTGLAGATGAAVITMNVWRGQSEAPQRTARRAMAATAVVVLIAGLVLAPGGVDRGFVIAVAALLATALALFALLSGDRPRAAEPQL